MVRLHRLDDSFVNPIFFEKFHAYVHVRSFHFVVNGFSYAIPEAYVITAVDVLSAARPGARRGTLENYIKRLGDLEKLAGEFPAVKNAYAISAGRELRVFVIPEKIDDLGALEM